MTSTFSPRHTSDATPRSTDQLTSSKPDFDVVSLLREHPSRTSDASKASGSSQQDSLDFGSVHSLYGSDSTGKSPETQQHQGPDAIKDDPSVPVELIDAASELRRAQDAFKNGDTERANEWMKDAEKNLKSLICDNAKPDGSDSGTHSDNSGSDSGSHSGSDSGSNSHGSDSGSGSGSDGSSNAGSDAHQPSDQQTQIQQMVEILAQALQALANGDMQQFQQLLSGLLAQVEAMTQSNNGPADNAVIPGQGQDSGFGQSDGTNNPTPGIDANGNPISGPSGLDNPLTGLPRIPGLPGLDGSNPLSGLPQLPGLPGLDGSNPLSGLPQLPGLPGLDGSNPLSGLPQLPGLPGLDGSNLVAKLPQLPGLPQLPELPQLPKLPQLPELPSLPGLSGSRGSDNSSSSGLPSLPGLPDLGSIFG